jgi:hypothetical protein
MLGTITPKYSDKEIFYPDEERNNLARNMADDFVVQKFAELTMTGELNMRDVVWMVCNSVRGNITPTQPDVVNEPLHFLWTVAPTLTAANTPDIANGIDTFTIEFGDNVQAYEMEYVFSTALEITGGPGEPCQFSWDIAGRQLTETTFTGALTSPANVDSQRFPFNLSKFYIDANYAALGTTQVTGLLRAFRWRLETMFSARFAADGNLYFSSLNEDKKKVELELTYYRDGTNSEGEKDKYDARTTAYLQVELNGATEMDAGESNPPYVRLQGAFRYTDWPEAGDEDGVVVETVTAESVYDSTGTQQFGVLIGTTLSAYP